ncbi:MAG TPA: DinB family protein [Phycisphaerales bacterium]|nr:DinB family protein [Phycisphaerales bacterium]
MSTRPRDSYDTIGAILSIHAMVNGFLLDAVEDVPESRMTEQPGAIVNHPAWTLSHLNAYAGTLLSMLDDPSVPTPTADAEMERYGYGTTPVVDRAAYATKRDLIDRFRDRNARLAAAVADKHADYFPRPSPEKYRPSSPTIGHIAIALLVAHPPHHLGQLKQWRRAAGIVEKA